MIGVGVNSRSVFWVYAVAVGPRCSYLQSIPIIPHRVRFVWSSLESRSRRHIGMLNFIISRPLFDKMLRMPGSSYLSGKENATKKTPAADG